MERNVQRINGEVTHLHELSVDELNQMRAYAAQRVHEGLMDIDKLEGEINSRRDLGTMMLRPQLEVTQLVQSDFEYRIADL